MAAATVLPGQNAIRAEDWYSQHLPSSPMGDGHAEFQEQGLSTGVRVTDNGRLDIKFSEQRPWLGTLKRLIEEHPNPIREEYEYPTVSPEEEDVFPLRLNIVIQVVGSRGDIQPFIVIGKELQKHGHRVRLATHLPFRDGVKEAGLEFFDIGGDPAELMAFMVRNPGLMPDLNTIRSGALLKRRHEMKAIFSGCWRACYEPGDGTNLHQLPDNLETSPTDHCAQPFVADVIIANPPGFAHLSCAERLGIPLNMMFTMPWSPTQSFPHPLANVRSQHTKPSVANFASYAVAEVMMWEGLGDLINNFRKRELGLNPLDAIRAPSLVHRLQIPYTYLWSPSLLPKPDDWPDNIDVCGFQFLFSGSDYKPPDDLEAFLTAGDPPIYIGFGSIVVDNSDKLTNLLFEAVRQIGGQRALISRGWGHLGKAAEVPENIFLMGPCPHDWLFQHVSCVVHHGGAGTTAAGLLLGRPTVIVPFFGDQPFWGSIVARAGAGPQPIPYKQLTAEKLAAAINQALQPSIQEKASEIGKRMQKENGVQNAVRSFHHHLDVDSLRCSVCPDRPAVWWVRHLHVKLSAFAMSVLLQTGHINAKDIVLYRPQEYDTNRDPRGPLSATAEVLYGVVTNFMSIIVGAPKQVAHIFSEVAPKNKRHNSSRESAMAHFAESSSKQEQKDLGQFSMDHRRPSLFHGGGRNGESEEQQSQGNGRFPTRTEIERCASVAPQTEETLAEEFHLEKTRTGRFIRKHNTAQACLAETGNRTSRLVKHIIEYAILLPTDLTLSLSKGFHNAPKLYHDTTVQKIPKVIGIDSGFRAAGTEFIQGFYYGITGIVTQPAQGFQKAGSKGLIKGVGKGIGGALLKPAAGLCGLAGFPLDGLHKSIRKSLSKSKSKEIIRSRITQGVQEMSAASPEERETVISRWHEVRKSHPPRRRKHGREHHA